jgi:multicomponent Na+:H+ antiporter subunit E
VKAFGWNLLLALAWCALSGRLTAANYLVGFLVGFLVLWFLAPGPAATTYVRRGPLLVAFVGFYIVEVISASFRVAWDVITPRAHRRPGILAVPLDVETDAEIALLSNLLTFSPGTLSLDVTSDRKAMLVHEMFIDEPERAKARIKQRFERWVLRIMR